MYTAADFKKGLKVEIEGEPWRIIDFEFHKPGKGHAVYRCKLKNMLNGSTVVRNLRSSDKLKKANLEDREMYFSYEEGNFLVFNDAETFEEYRVPKKGFGDSYYLLTEDSLCKVLLFKGTPVEVTLPNFVEKEIVGSEPGAKGNTATNATKTATLDNGYKISVPLFVNQGDVIKIDTRTGKYVERAQKS